MSRGFFEWGTWLAQSPRGLNRDDTNGWMEFPLDERALAQLSLFMGC